MKLRILVDNNTYIDRYYFGEPALAFYIEDGDERILFDTGYSHIFLENAALMGIDLGGLTKLVISHGHVDHTGGLGPLAERFDTRRLPLYAHPTAFRKLSAEGINTGSLLRKEELEKLYDLRLSAEPIWLTNKLLYLGQVPQLNDFEPRRVTGQTIVDGVEVPDMDMDDTALAYKGEDGLFIITGCSHSGICNIIQYARQITGESRVAGVIGGFHLFDVDDRLSKTIEYFMKLGIKSIYPCHCVSLAARAEMMKHLDVIETGVGMELITE